MRKIVLMACLMLAGCATEAISLISPSGEKVQCGPYSMKVTDDNMIGPDMRLRACVNDFQRQGYKRAGDPVAQ